MLVLSVFPGVDLLGRAFEESGFVVVRGPDLLWGGDIRRFHPPRGVFAGVLGGSPCQDFSRARRAPATGYGRAMLLEFGRVVQEASPDWALLENVPGVPDVEVCGYHWQRTAINQGWFCGVNRLRHIQWWSRAGVALELPLGGPCRGLSPAALANDGRGFEEVCRVQGLPPDYALPGFTREAAVAAVGNGVPLVLGRVLAGAVRRAVGLGCGVDPVPLVGAASAVRRCKCGCGRRVGGAAFYAGPACRKRAERARRSRRGA